MTDFASLGLSVDTRQVKEGVAELDKLTASGARAEKASSDLARAQAVVASQASALRAEVNAGRITQEQYVEKLTAAARSLDGLRDAQRATQAEYARISKEASAASAAISSAGQQTKQMGAAFATTGAQIRSASAATVTYSPALLKMAQSAALGSDGLKKAGDAAQATVPAVMRLSSSIGLLGNMLGFTLGGVIASAVSGLAALALQHMKASDAQDAHKDAAEELTKATNELHSAVISEQNSTAASIKTDIAKANSLLTRASAARQAAVAELQLAKARLEGAKAGARSGEPGSEGISLVLPSIEADTKRLDAEIKKQEALINKNVQTIRGKQGQLIQQEIAEKYDKSAAAAGKYERKLDMLNGMLRIGIINEQVYRSELDKATATREREEEAAKKSERTRKERKKGLTDEQKAYEQAVKAAQGYIENLELEIEKIGKNAAQIRQIEIAHAKAAAPTAELKNRIDELNVAREKALSIADAETKAKERKKNDADLTEPAERELKLLGLTGEAREKAALKLEFEAKQAQMLAGDLNISAAALQLWYDTNLRVIEGESALEREAQAARDLIDALGAVAEQAQVVGGIMSSAFGGIGDVFGGIVANMADYQAQAAAMAEEVKAGTLKQETAAKRLATLDMKNTAQAIAGVKSLFKEKSTAFKVMQAIEMAYAAFQLANTIKSIAMDTTKTASSLANSATRTTANTAEGASKIFAELGPWAFPVVAAMVAVIAALGFKGGGGGKTSAPMSAEDVQAAQGTGTVLGDSKAKSESIARSLELVAANTNEMLEYDNSMLRALRGIEQGIEKLAASIAAELSLPGGAFDQDKLGLGTKSSSGFLGLFGSSTTKTLFDQGVEFFSTNLVDAISNGLDGQTYQIVEKVKKKSGFLGIGGGTKTSYKTTTGEVDAEISNQIGLILGSVRDSVVEAAKVLGLDVQAALNTFTVEIGKISFKDMNAEEISQTLQNVFSKVADQMAGFAVEGLAEFQKAGEGLFETLMRLAKNYTTIDVTLKSIGLTFGMVGSASIALRENLIDLVGSLEDFVDQVGFYQQNFLTEAQQIAPIRAQVEAELARLGLSSVDTKAEFANVVNGLDLTTTAGQELFAALMALAPAFNAVEQYEAQQAEQAANLAKQRANLEIALMEAQGDAAGALAAKRAMELAAMDESLRALQQQVWQAQDIAKAKDQLAQAYQRERSELEQTIKKFGDLSKSLRAFRDTLFGGAAGGMTYNQALAKLMTTGALAASGNEAALGELQGVSKSFLDISKDSASTLQQYQRDVALVARYVDGGIAAAEGQMTTAEKQLKALETQVGSLIDINQSVLSVRDAILKLNQLMGGTSNPAVPVPSPSAPRTPRQGREDREDRNSRNARMEQQLEQVAAATAQTAASLNQLTRTVRTWDRGGSMAVATDSDTPLATTVTP